MQAVITCIEIGEAHLPVGRHREPIVRIPLKPVLWRKITIVSILSAGNGGDKRKYDQYFLEAMMQRQKGNYDAAFDLLLRCVEIDSTQPAAFFYLSQYYNYGLKDKQRSLECLEKATTLDPKNTTYHEMLAGSYLSANRLKEGKKQLEILHEIDPGRDNINDVLVELYKQTGDFDSAIRLLEDMERADGKNESLSETQKL